MEIRLKKKTLDEIFPIWEPVDDFVISKRQDLTVGWRLDLPASYSLDSQEYDTFCEHWCSAMKMLPPWCIVHRQDVFRYESYVPRVNTTFLASSFEEHHSGRKYLVHEAYVFLTFSTKRKVTATNRSTGLKGLIAWPSKLKEKDILKMEGEAEKFISVVTGGGIVSAERLRTEDLGTNGHPGIIDRYLNLGRGTSIRSDWELTTESVRIGDDVLCSYAIGEADVLPTVISNTNRIESLCSQTSKVYLSFAAQMGVLQDCNHIVNQYYVTVPQDETLAALESKRGRMTAATSSTENRVHGEEIQEFIDAVHAESKTIVYTHLNVLLWGRPSERTLLESKLEKALAMMSVRARRNLFDTPVLWYASIPGAESEIGWENYMMMPLESAAAMGLYETFDKEIPGGWFRVTDRIRHIPMDIDFGPVSNDRGLTENSNGMVFGPSGSGKSFFMNSMVQSAYDHGAEVTIIDVGDSYEGLSSVIREESGGRDGHYFSWSRENPLTFNPFEGFENWLVGDTLNVEETGYTFFMSFLCSAWTPDRGSWSSDERSTLQDIVRRFVIARKGMERPVFNDFYEYLQTDVLPRILYVAPRETVGPGGVVTPRAKEEVDADQTEHGYIIGGTVVTRESFDISKLIRALEPYSAKGVYGFLLNDPEPRDLFNTAFSVFEVDRLKQINDERFYQICILCILNAFDIRMRRTGPFRMLVIEEAWKAVSNENSAAFLKNLWKTARKYNCGAWVVTQEIDDVLQSQTLKESILVNSSMRVLLDMRSFQNRFDDIQRLMGLTDRGRALALSVNMNLLPALNYKEFFMSWGASRMGVYALEASRQQGVCFESNKVRKQPFLDRARECGSHIQAAREIAARMSNQNSR